jgi:predicted DCC family thiol-disulfide oxidoreductase YuxK
MNEQEDKVILLFDGVCNLCNSTVNFILPRDKRDRFRFATLQSESGKYMLSKYSLDPARMDTVVLIEQGTPYFRSEAGLRILKNLGGMWLLAYALVIIPIFIRDPIYNLIARNRYRWFGKKQSCRVPEESWKKKFIS